MSDKKKTNCIIRAQREIAPSVWDLRLETPLAKGACPGQFAGVFVPDDTMLLPRPISICGARDEELRLVYRIAGKGTARLSAMRAGETVEILGMSCNGFPMEEAAGKRVLLYGGGIGIPPMLFAAQTLRAMRDEGKARSVTAVLGYRDGDTFLADECAAVCDEVRIATENGAAGIHGNVLDAVREEETFDLIFACGPKPMLKAIQARYAPAGQKPEAGVYLSLEERMACGIGACLACVCKTVHTDAHSQVKNARVCTEGPVFPAEQVIL